MTVKEIKDWLNNFPEGKQFLVTGYLPEYTYRCKILDIKEKDDTVEMLTDIDQ